MPPSTSTGVQNVATVHIPEHLTLVPEPPPEAIGDVGADQGVKGVFVFLQRTTSQLHEVRCQPATQLLVVQQGWFGTRQG